MKIKPKKIVKNQYITETVTAVRSGIHALSSYYSATNTRAQDLIQAGKHTTVRFFQNVAANYEKCRPVEELYASYQTDLDAYREDISAPAFAHIQTQLKTWRATQMGRVLQGQEIEAFSGLNDVFAATARHGILEQLNDIISDVISSATSGRLNGDASALASSPFAHSLVGASSLKDTPVWTMDNRYFAFSYHYRTAVREHFVSGLEVMRPKTGKLELVTFAPQKTDDKQLIHAVTSEQWLPLPTALTDKGEPRSLYRVDPQVGRIYWSPELGQFFLELLHKPASPRPITITAYTHIDGLEYLHHLNQWLPRLTPYTATLPAPRPNADIKAALSPWTREIFETAERMGRRELYGEYALTPHERLQYAAARLSGSWTYDRQPKNIGTAKADGPQWLGHLHQDKKVMTANCNVANTELAVAARAYGYPVRIVTGFSGNGKPSLDAPGHEWVEMRVGNTYQELDATPGYTLQDNLERLDNDLRLKLQRIAAYDRNPKYRDRDALYAQLSQLTNGAGLRQLFTTLAALPIEEEKLEKKFFNPEEVEGDRWVTGQYVAIRKEIAPGKWRQDVYNRDPLMPNAQGKYRGYVISTMPSPLDLQRPLEFAVLNYEHVRFADTILEWHIDAPFPTDAPRGKRLNPRHSLTIQAITGEYATGKTDYVSIPGYPDRRFRSCVSVDDIKEVWDPRDTQGRSTLVEGLQRLKFVHVRVPHEEGDIAELYAFNAETGLLIASYFNSGTEGINLGTDPKNRRWELTISPDYTRILATELSAETYRDHANHAVVFAHAFFEHMQGRQIMTATDRGLLVQALTLFLRHPKKMSVNDWHAHASISYLLSEARRLHIQPDEIQEASAASIPTSPKAVICDGIWQPSPTPKPGCEVLWPERPMAPNPSSVDGLWRDTLSYIQQDLHHRGFDPAALSPAKRAWLEKLIKTEFKPTK